MITTDPVGDWSWEVLLSGGPVGPDLPTETAGAVWGVLEKCGLATSAGTASISAVSANGPRRVWFHEDFTSPDSKQLRSGSPISDAMLRTKSSGADCVLTIRIQSPGFWLEAGRKNRAEKLFLIQVEMWKSALLVVTLETFSDAWLTCDTRDRAQPEIFEENAPRLAEALAEISSYLKSPVSPGDPNRFATPVADGFEDPSTEGAPYVDSWGTFEAAARSRKLHTGLPSGSPGYEEVTDYPVRYVAVTWNGRKVGYIWASVGDYAAGYAPRTAAGEDAFDVGKKWILLLREAHSKGLSALDALEWLTRRSPQQGAGEIAESDPLEVSSLDELEELSGRY
ncbi:hypothetical protein ACWGQ9_02815 [Streptomyces parvus]|uniref:hypothetical protein n=1 Tax=unclassified Streptomyces TaxID=2593676 RepID=UPI001587314B|nr:MULTISPECIES: hypothetical protein [unclassified Streptomyces]NUV70042.1 hypothetical protein [Streptomyces sp. CAI-121]NUW16186.1 hypothetical protein [Streptomyces sp. CAI-68]